MDAFDQNKFNEESFTKYVLANSMIVSYGFISAIDFDTVTVTTLVSDKKFAEKVNCIFMNLGNSQFSLTLNPELNMRVVVLSPNKGATGMYENDAQILKQQGRNFISNPSPAVYSSQFCFCIPLLRSTVQSLSSMIINSDSIVGEIKHEMIMSLFEAIDIDIMGDSSIELHEGTSHIRKCDGNMEQTFGMVQGAGGAEKSGTYVYKETYGKYSSVEKNLESGVKVTIGKAYEKPFLDSKGSLLDSSAPVTVDLGTKAPVTLTFGESAVVVKADTTAGIDITLTGSLPVKITAATGKLTFKNGSGSLKDVLDKIADLCSQINTVGGPAAQSLEPSLVTEFSTTLKTLIANIFE